MTTFIITYEYYTSVRKVAYKLMFTVEMVISYGFDITAKYKNISFQN